MNRDENFASKVIVINRNLYTEQEMKDYLKRSVFPVNAISWAAENGYTDIVKSLIDLGANVSENHDYPIELASREGHTEIVKMLLDAGAKGHINNGYCLRLASYSGHTKIAKMLLEAGADPCADDYFALKLALDRNKKDIVEMLIDAICKKRIMNKKNKE